LVGRWMITFDKWVGVYMGWYVTSG
jgi:hypothetical protein